MTEISTRHPSDQNASELEAYFGNEEQRFEMLKNLDYNTFKNQILSIRGSLNDDRKEVQFAHTNNGNLGGQLYPRPEDKDDLIRHTLKQAQSQNNIQDAALVLATGVVFTHPFYDGNGRTSRTLYGYYSRGIEIDSNRFEARALRANYVGGDLVNFGDVIDTYYQRTIDHLVYKEEDFKPIADGDWYVSQDPEAAQKFYSADREYAGMSKDEADELDALLGEEYGHEGDNPGRYASNSKAIIYGLSKLAHKEKVTLPVVKRNHKDLRPWTQVIIPDALALLTGEQKVRLTRYIRDYNTKYAKAAVDLIAVYGDELFKLPDGSTISFRDEIVDKTSNYLTSKVMLGRPALEEIREQVKRAKAQAK